MATSKKSLTLPSWEAADGVDSSVCARIRRESKKGKRVISGGEAIERFQASLVDMPTRPPETDVSSSTSLCIWEAA